MARDDIGAQVEDATGRVGILRDVIPDYEDPAEPSWLRRKRPTAFLRPAGGGAEWLVPPDDVRRV
ncbi:hypothetical protein DVK44_15040 [Streptomyces paludis]|uniref:PRC-barrel domain containing protein n=1 Tax=Streptomyces paludis TaxID=2282738 RepID=A0A345I0Y2_9ACTN|nr:hypothetical protein DVK44_15040 [Streptomyces paludis]